MSRSLSDVNCNILTLFSVDIGTALTNHQTHVGPSGQDSGQGSIGGSRLQAFCITINYINEITPVHYVLIITYSTKQW